jgi:large subunit ribosomal protein L29
MKTTDIKGLTVTELKEALRKLQFAHQISSVENPMKLKETRKLIARLSTELTVKERAAK